MSVFGDPTASLAALHGRCLRMIAGKPPRHSKDLSTAARQWRGILPPRLLRTLHHLDITYAVLRHYTLHGCLDLEEQLAAAVVAGRVVGIGSLKHVATRLGSEADDHGLEVGRASGTNAFDGGDEDLDSSDSAKKNDGAVIDAFLWQLGCEPRAGGRYEEYEHDQSMSTGLDRRTIGVSGCVAKLCVPCKPPYPRTRGVAGAPPFISEARAYSNAALDRARVAYAASGPCAMSCGYTSRRWETAPRHQEPGPRGHRVVACMNACGELEHRTPFFQRCKKNLAPTRRCSSYASGRKWPRRARVWTSVGAIGSGAGFRRPEPTRPMHVGSRPQCSAHTPGPRNGATLAILALSQPPRDAPLSSYRVGRPDPRGTNV